MHPPRLVEIVKAWESIKTLSGLFYFRGLELA